MCIVTIFSSVYWRLFCQSFIPFVFPGGAASEAHPVFAAPPEAPGLRAQLPPTTDLEDRDGEPGPGR